MADLDVLRPSDTDDGADDSPEALKVHRNDEQLDVDDSESTELFELPAADLSGEELSIRAIPMQNDEFTCTG